jgi:hypothetical protein
VAKILFPTFPRQKSTTPARATAEETPERERENAPASYLSETPQVVGRRPPSGGNRPAKASRLPPIGNCLPRIIIRD